GLPGTQVPFDVLCRESDILSLHLPLTEGTHHLISREVIASMKPGAILVNTARGALVDSEALIDALESGHLGGAALDVVEGEAGLYHFNKMSDQ
ncbi:NAD(P)-dependent oxidoreductase, partial [Salmonella enterica subsp. enterica serovar Enteritidis]|uniref:NAD(P)-dependent oxidoreductase n=1 Tax=Salmonella enterica TaxID=28901 RepID=UPI0039EABDA9